MDIIEKLDPTRQQRRDDQRDQFVSGLREFADWLASHPEIDAPSGVRVLIPVGADKTKLATIARALGGCDKYGDDNWFGVTRSFGPIVVDAYGGRAELCTRIVKGVREVTREIPDPDALKVTVTETVEDVEWVCEPLLASEAPDA